MYIFNPVISEKSPNCHCRGCFHAFWLHNDKEHDFLSCHCDLLHSFTFPNPNANEKIILCKGCEDDIPFSKRADHSACRHCKNSLWYVTDKRRLYCFCLHLQCLVYGLDRHLNPLPLILDCNGVSPAQASPNKIDFSPTNIF